MRISCRRSWSACLGNLFEHYDTALFGFLSPFLAPLIFPEQEPIVSLILTYMIIPLGMLFRPIGALFFGYIGDVYGRSQALFLTLAGMSIVSGFIALSPTYLQAGILAPILFCVGRALQNFLAAGETMGGAIFILENNKEKHHDILSSIYGVSTIGGLLLASMGVFLLSHYFQIDPGWRFLYLFGCVTALFGCLIRRFSVPESTSVKLCQTFSNWKGTLKTYWKPLIFIAINSGFTHATYSIALVLMNGFIPLVSSLTKADMVKVNTFLLLLDFATLPLFGWLSSKIHREKLMLAASLGVVLFAIPLFLSLQGASMMGVVIVRIAFVILGVAFCAPFYAWTQQLIPPESRYAVISFGYAIGSQLLGSPAAAFALWCFQKTGMISSVAWYWMALGLASTLSIALTSGFARKSIPAPLPQYNSIEK